MPEVNFSVTAKSESPTKTVVKARGLEMIVDEPENLGGTNAGPNPVEYILGALAGCLNVVGHMVAEEMDFEINDMEIKIEGPLDPGKLNGQKEDVRAGYKDIQVEMQVDVDSEVEEATLKNWLKEVEERCPVSDNISRETPLTLSVSQ